MSLLEEIKLALHYTRRSRAPFACGGRSQRRHGTITVPTGNANCALRGRFGKPCRWDNRVSQGWAASALQARCVNRLCEGGLGGRDARIGSVRGMTVLQTYERKAALKWRAKPLLQEEAQKFAPRWRRLTKTPSHIPIFNTISTLINYSCQEKGRVLRHQETRKLLVLEVVVVDLFDDVLLIDGDAQVEGDYELG